MGRLRHDLTAKMSVLDLLFAARYEGASFLHWRGGQLSIFQRSRILSAASPERSEMREPAEAALSQPGFDELNSQYLPRPVTTKTKRNNRPERPLRRPTSPAAALPFAAPSTLGQVSGLPVAFRRAVRAFAFMPRDRSEADQRIANHGRAAGEPLLNRLAEESRRLSPRSRSPALHRSATPKRPVGIDEPHDEDCSFSLSKSSFLRFRTDLSRQQTLCIVRRSQPW